jgi:hypothetical protein
MQGPGAKMLAVNWAGTGPIASDAIHGASRADEGLALLFPAGHRPTADAVRRAVETSMADQGRQAARISHEGRPDQGWLELLASGLTFDLTGLAPAEPAALGTAHRLFGIARKEEMLGKEAIRLAPGPHLASAGAMIPVFRTMASIAAKLASALGAFAVCWAPAESCMEAGYFARIAGAWLEGGAFPALGLTGIDRQPDGSFETTGLAWFTGQELRVEGRAGEAPADTVKLAVRMIDHLVRNGAIEERERLTGPGGEAVLAIPAADGRSVRLQRGA